MHAIERPHLPRIGVVALGAVLVAIVALLLAAPRVGNIAVSSGTSAAGASPVAAGHTPGPAWSWFTNPFASPSRVVLPWAKAMRR